MSDSVFTGLLHTHSGSWVVMNALFVLTLIFKNQKVTGILLRIFYLIMLATGISMLVQLGFPAAYIVKGILAILLIGVMEMLVGRSKKGKAAMPAMWVVWVVLLAIVVLLGYGVISF